VEPEADQRKDAVTDQMKPHPGGLKGRLADAQTDLQLLKASGVPPIERRWAQLLVDALQGALDAEPDTG
jgi:hypothetical protein